MDAARHLIDSLATRTCGPDLEYDPAFLRVQLMVEGSGEAQYGEKVYAGKIPEWATVQQCCMALLAQSLDLRIAVLLARARLESECLGGFSQALTIVALLVEHHWEGVHPQLDPDDAHDPTLRLNVLAELCSPDLLECLQRRLDTALSAPVSASGTVGASPDPTRPAFGDGIASPPIDEGDTDDRLARTLTELLGTLDALSSTLVRRVARSLSWEPLGSRLREALHQIGIRAALRGDSGSAAPCSVEPAIPYLPNASGQTEMSCRSRRDVLHVLASVREYYLQHEPSSPIPLLLRRVEALVDRDFLDIIADLAPTSLHEIRALAGLRDRTSDPFTE